MDNRQKSFLTMFISLLLLALAVACTPAGSEPVAEPDDTPEATETEMPPDEPMEETAVPQVQIQDITWYLDHTVVGGDAVVPPPQGAEAYFEITDEGISGFAGCNNFSGTVSYEDGLSFGPLATTRKACNETIMTFENNLLNIFTNTAGVDHSEGILSLKNADGLLLATFLEAEEKTLFVGPEQAECVGVAPQMCLLVKESQDEAYTFFYDSITGFEWEEGFEYELRVRVTEIAQPLADASSLNYSLIEVVDKTAVDTDSSESGSESSELTLIGPVWQWVRFEDSADINNIEVRNPENYTIQFMEDGNYAIKNDCNSGGGSYEASDSGLTINPGASTLAACGEESLDSHFSKNLLDVGTYVIQDGTLYLNLIMDAGNMVFMPAE